ncbi:VOC family protein [Arthrobacter sp. 35W]|uniref:VOC family protein n=1 Tax=Arthrobacter sp. 35W TaxID=1132441 RepID=UPI000404FFB8|nr:VOC family protein [Arthrobacter sp. 35W]
MKAPTACLWFDTQAEEAAEFYVALFDDSRIHNVSRYPEEVPGTPGKALVVDFEIGGRPFNALNGGPQFTFTEAVSFIIECADQAELDKYWDALTADGEESMCGWLKDKYGLSWQLVPSVMGSLLGGPDPEASGRAMQAMLGMKRLDIAGLQAAYDGV